MPEYFSALAVDATPVHQQQPELPRDSPASARAGRLRQTFENDLVLGYLDLAEALAARFEARGRERADLNQVAYLGLVKAARGFDQTKGESFPAYAAPTITGELKRYLRDRTWVVRPPRHIQDLRTRMFRAEPELTQSLGRNPSVAELAGVLDEDPAAVQEAISASSSMHPDSLDAVNPHSDAPSIGEVLACPETPLERLEELACLRDAIQDLDTADRELLYRRYFCEETQVQLGKRLGMSQMQVSRRLAKVLVELQRRLEGSSLAGSSDEAPANAGRQAGVATGSGRTLQAVCGQGNQAPAGKNATRRGSARAGNR
ncbi:sigma-70 family RNA polymerase sigma factor [Arthrobacter sp. BB-1]|jgi:RNA polymerase sigma-B factor|uniref:sigma-70 family RNA polymerase sigma factor n=1 Tax=Micrococcaceae TaxID=1268 RepID=UPI0011118AA9|nr:MULTISPECIES: sigma-70 family RNA polymerase sigma factor [Micrococcaceae]TNB76239.1 sigma-70 family RNA polymerase sigma factor [Arthrobacter sp. BB-1]UEL29014.1 sigma-70 family RNA polymerase sigma factor [Pseudarthrobacter sp. L1SW]